MVTHREREIRLGQRSPGWYTTADVCAVLGINKRRFRELLNSRPKLFQDVEQDGGGGWHPDIVELMRYAMGRKADQIGKPRVDIVRSALHATNEAQTRSASGAGSPSPLGGGDPG